MATYNGEKFIEEQIISILGQLGANDELIISDDSSTDRTIEIINSFKDERIKLYKDAQFHSPIYNFENALKKVSKEIIILSDQDDKWLEDRINEVVKIFDCQPEISLIVNRCNKIDKLGNITDNSHFKDTDPVNHSLIHNLLHNPYLGCCMAFRRDILEIVLPFPKHIAMHDIWIGLIAQLNGKCIYLNKVLVHYRRHEASATNGGPYYPLWYKIWYRLILSHSLVCRQLRK